ncbi:poly [ADP-ribose] polymerase-like [Bradysia coprophila]|uniref:poly [ADP-ribose] polymerase-like n=1 Tax=Bradysia coprophila TaxID=38358 RepID=UPI00187DB74A|nr:poly [ADP-ribose] polymerase-like [Bradysia coprophila]
MNRLRYKTRYAAYNEACRGCYSHIENGNVLLSVMVQSRKDDKKEAVNYHVRCFFEKQRLTTEGDVDGFEKLRFADQKKIRDYITRHNTKIVLPKKRGKESGTNDIKMSAKALRDFGVEYSKSARANCCGCRQKIAKSIVRVKKVVYTTEVGINFGGQALWHHLECFAKLMVELGWYGSGDQLPGFTQLTKDDQKMVLSTISPAPIDDIPEFKKPKLQESVDELEKLIAVQNTEFYSHRDFVHSKLPKSNWIQLLEVNKQKNPQKSDEILDLVAEILTFGALLPCPECSGQLVFSKNGYSCTGRISEWAKCEYNVKEPARNPCQIPTWLQSHFAGRKVEKQTRAIKCVEATSTAFNKTYDPDAVYLPKVEHTKPPLYLMEVVVIGTLSKSRDKLKPIIEKMGGKLVTKLHPQTAVVLSTQAEVDKMSKRMQEVQRNNIQVCTENFLDDIKGGGTLEYIAKNSICDWGSDPFTRIDQNEPSMKVSKSLYTRSVPTSVKLKLVDGTAVDPASLLDAVTHVYVSDGTKYFAILNLTDIQEDKNSYFKIQLLEANDKRSYYVFSSWGRIGTTIGDNNTKYCADLQHAIKAFRQLYKTKTGNDFNAKKFVKKPGMFYPVEVDYGDDESLKKLEDLKSNIPSKLPESVQQLTKMIFDVTEMKKQLLEFNLDTTKMPLGKISNNQCLKAMAVLSELANIVKAGGGRTKFISESNKFYTLIPHNFGERRPPVIDTIELISTKREMLDTLIQMELAYNLMQEGNEENVNPLDKRYSQLKNKITPMDKRDPMYNILEQYLQNTHAPTHQNYTIDLEQIFEVDRQGERERYEAYANLHNRKLLWHGSRLTNFVGILSHGLKIAPPEAPVTGYMFGKGVYFADMSSKSANYCYTNINNTTGLLMLCEVALGNSLELQQAKMIQKLPKGIHSVKGCGKTYPNPDEAVMMDHGCEIPTGMPVNDLSFDSQLLYNEYIVYDTSQIQAKYLMKVKFNF